MILFIAVIAALILFSSIVVASIKTNPRSAPKRSALIAVNEILKLDSMSISNLNQMFDDSEYLLLKSNPALVAVATRLRKDKQELALIWLSLLVKDLRKLSEFRRFLIRGGAPVRAMDELRVLFTFVSSMLLLTVLKLFVLIFGPFAVHGIACRAKVAIEVSSYASAKLLGALPSGTWSDIAQSWRSQGFAS